MILIKPIPLYSPILNCRQGADADSLSTHKHYLKIALNFPAFLPSTHNGCRKISVVYEWIMKNEASPSPFWFARHEDYPPRPLFAPAIGGLSISYPHNISCYLITPTCHGEAPAQTNTHSASSSPPVLRRGSPIRRPVCIMRIIRHNEHFCILFRAFCLIFPCLRHFFVI